MSQVRPDYDSLCPHCGKVIGEHTIRGYGDCLKEAGFDYRLPFEETPGGPMQFPGLEGEMVGEITIAAGMLETVFGWLPILRYTFFGPGLEPMERRQLGPFTLVMDEQGLQSVEKLTHKSVKASIMAARKKANGQ